jgi:hypothetical protein
VAKLRLAGQVLTITLARTLTPRRFRGHPYISVVCSERITTRADGSGLALVPRARRAFRVPAHVRHIRARLDVDAADRIDDCWIDWRSAAGSRTIPAEMRLVRGQRPNCTDPGTDRILFWNAEITVVGSSLGGDRFSAAYADRVCDRATGEWHPLQVSLYDRYGVDHATDAMEIAGRWVAWAWHRTLGASACGLERFSLTGGVKSIPVSTDPAAPPYGTGRHCADALALDAAGRMAWAERVATVDRPSDVHVNALAPSGATVELASAPAGTRVTDLAISPDGRTVSWREGVTPRSAPLP